MPYDLIRSFDPELYESMDKELLRQRTHLELIASENFTSEAVMEAMGSHLTNKYAEGYPSARYYGGCDYVDEVERLAQKRACALFGAEYANVQPHSGSQANVAAYVGLLEPGDTIMGMSLDAGGHLTHGSRASMTGHYWNSVSYGISPETEMIDYDELRAQVKEVRPQLLVCGASAYPRIIDFKELRSIADEVGAYLLADISHISGLVVAGLHPSPVPYADVVTTTTHKTLAGPRGALILCKEVLGKRIDRGVFPKTQGGPLMHTIAGKAVCFREAMSPEFWERQKRTVDNAAALAEVLMDGGLRLTTGGTDNHLMLVDVASMGRTGREIQELLESAHITANKNAIPFDTLSPSETSGLRIGTPAITTRGLGVEESRQIGEWILDVVKSGDTAVERVKEGVLEMCTRFPLYPSWE